MATSVAQSIPIAIPRPPTSGNDDRADKSRNSQNHYNGLAASPNKSLIPSSLRASASSLSGVVPRASSFTTSDCHGGSYSQSPRARAAPANSILLRRGAGLGQEFDQTGLDVAETGTSPRMLLPPAPVVTHIPAVPVDAAAQRKKERREREKLREKEERERREREIRERELELADAIEEQEEKVWGIPKKAFYFGLGSVPGAINFNAQMAMMAGWGNGSGGQGDYIRTPNDSLTRPPYKSRTSSGSTKRPSSSRSASSSTKAGSQKAKPSRTAAKKEEKAAANKEAIEALRSSNSSYNSAYTESDGSESDGIDAEELAALNAIINTRRSMAAAQALASGEVKLPAPKRPVRPCLATLRAVSMDTVATTPSSTSDVTSPDVADDADVPESKSRPPFRRNESTESQLEGAGSCKIRFAPLPRPSPIDDDVENLPPGGESLIEGQIDEKGLPLSEAQAMKALSSKDGSDSDADPGGEDGDDLDSGDESESDYEDVDEAEKWRRRMKKYKSRWYMMGLPPQAFKSEYYRSWRKWSSDNAQQQPSSRPGSARSDREDTPGSVVDKVQTSAETKQQRRLSTGTLGLMSSAEIVRKAAGEVLDNTVQTSAGSPKPAASPATDGKAQPRRGRRGRRNSTSQKGSSTARSASAGSAVDKEERMRRRQLILAARPGGTGMVTLPDGTKVRARRVDDAAPDGDDGYPQEWGFAGLAKAQKLEAPEDAAQDDTEVEPDATEGGDEDEVPPPRTASPTGADALSDVTPRNASPDGQDRGAESRLSLQERVRRRHEAEVAALGAEVLAAHRRKVGAAKENAAATGTEATTVPPASDAGTTEPATATQQNAEAKKEAVKAQDRPGATVRKDSVPPSKYTCQPLANIFHRRPSRSTSPQSAAVASESTARTSDSPDARAQRPEKPGRSRSKTSNASSDHLRSSMDGRSLDYNTPLYSPMRSLPRKPDAKGYAVVPLPSQLGVRPDRPREGRVWEWSDDESSLSSEAEEATTTAKGDKGADGRGAADAGDQDEDETTNMDLNEEEMAEEEQRKAAHAKRATTSAAGLERMLVRTKSGATSTSLAATNARGLPAVQRTRTLDGELSAIAARDQSSPARRIASTGLTKTPTQSRSASMSVQPSGGLLPGASIPSPTRSRKKTSSPSGSQPPGTRSRGGESAAAQADSSSTEDDQMWSRSVPSALGMGQSLSPTTSRTSQTGSVRSSLQPTSPPLHAPTAYFGGRTSTEQQERRRSMRKPSMEGARSRERSAKKQAERDDDAMDYGWPSSLKGSLYDR
ncbi:hypothetical protein BCV69DRAFT_275404 [Microstroma glucosiphilum]|uniref:Uncharacterized protein n=1 Tax=Pseudomicrostroma glucosiphilum TaxID=1684307 RepID=A0A316UGL2_9BASI|nr:hypothetical protein BCV69DRAFT_275404 [Pseudomicrostroma glucosiphilum]PWN24054.1 hypothetical protein BCV69DRAFT_275404 [Pseudomicrostroma glucosiphilum]